MRKIVQVLLVGSCLLGTGSIVQAGDLGVSIGGKRGFNADVSLSAKDGLGADVSASIGGRKGINADVDADIGDGVDADIDASIGGRKGVNANVDASIGDGDGIDADVNATIGGNHNPAVGLGDDDDAAAANQATDPSTDAADPGNGALTSRQRQAFNSMPASERKALITRCGSVNSGNSDAALVSLCKLLRMSAAR